jgi:TPR repeat protein
VADCYRAGVGTTVDNARAIKEFDKACQAGIASSCFSASSMYRSLNEPAQAEKRLKQGCQISTGFVESSAAYFERGLPAKTAAVPPICSSIGN